MKLSELKALAEKATPGPWHIGHLNENDPETADIEGPNLENIADEVRDKDRLFIVASRNHIEELISRIELLSIGLEAFVIGDHNRVLDDAGELGREILEKAGPRVPLGEDKI